MKKHILIIISLVGFLSSCSDKISIESIDFKVELLDDVSPVKVRCTVDGNWDYVRWGADGGIYSDYESNTFEHVFLSEGTHTIEMSTWENGTKYIGEKEITIPEPATKLKISGFQFKKDNKEYSLPAGKYKISFSYYNSKEYKYHDLYFEIEGNDTDIIPIPSPAIFSINGYQDNIENFYFYCNLENVDNGTLIFRKRWSFVQITELIDLDASSHFIPVNNDTITILLEADWMP